MVDWYLIVSFVFVFGVFVEYTTVLWLTEKEMQRVEEREKKEKIKQEKNADNLDESAGSSKVFIKIIIINPVLYLGKNILLGKCKNVLPV